MNDGIERARSRVALLRGRKLIGIHIFTGLNEEWMVRISMGIR
jgi:hypothetical protein